VEQAKFFQTPSLQLSTIRVIPPVILQRAYFTGFETSAFSPPLFISYCNFRL
jgi:hypothetical protein